MQGCKPLSTGAFEETSPEAGHLRCQSGLPNAIDTGAVRVRAARRSPEMPAVIRPDSGSSGCEVVHLLRSLSNLFAARGEFVTGFMKEIDHSQSCHSRGAAGKYEN